MNDYYVHKYQDDKGDHEVHTSSCHKLPYLENRIYLGEFGNCHDAVREAKKYYSQVDGCVHCSEDCHNS